MFPETGGIKALDRLYHDPRGIVAHVTGWDPAVYSFASLPLYLLVNALVLESEVDTMLSLGLFWTYFMLLHLNRILNRVIRIAVIVTTGCHFYFVAREKVYFDAAGFLAVIIRNRYYQAMFPV